MLQLLPEATDRKCSRGRGVRGTRSASGPFQTFHSHYFSHKFTQFSRFVECFVKLLKMSHLHKYSDHLLESVCD